MDDDRCAAYTPAGDPPVVPSAERPGEWMCGFDGGPLNQHQQDHPNRPRPIVTNQTLEEGFHISKWQGGKQGIRCAATAGGRRIRRVLQSHAWRKGEHPAQKPSQIWATEFAIEPRHIRLHFTKAGGTQGLPKKAKQVIYKLLWRRVFFRGPGGPRTCCMCGSLLRGRGEAHVFFECDWAKLVWGRAMSYLIAAGMSPRAPLEEYMVNSRASWSSARGSSAGKIWRSWWACVVWAIWKVVCDRIHGDDGEGRGGVDNDQLFRRALSYAEYALTDCIKVQERDDGGSGEMVATASLLKEVVEHAARERRRGGGRQQGAGAHTLISAGGDDPT